MAVGRCWTGTTMCSRPVLMDVEVVSLKKGSCLPKSAYTGLSTVNKSLPMESYLLE